MRVLLATGEHRQQKGSKAYTLDICKTSLSQKCIFNYRVIPSLSGLAHSPSQMVPRALPMSPNQRDRPCRGAGANKSLAKRGFRSHLPQLGLSRPSQFPAKPKFGQPQGTDTETPQIHVNCVVRLIGGGLSFF